MRDKTDRFKLLVQRHAEILPASSRSRDRERGSCLPHIYGTPSSRAKTIYGAALHEKQCVPGANFRFDFYIEDEGTVSRRCTSRSFSNSEFGVSQTKSYLDYRPLVLYIKIKPEISTWNALLSCKAAPYNRLAATRRCP